MISGMMKVFLRRVSRLEIALIDLLVFWSKICLGICHAQFNDKSGWAFRICWIMY